MNPSTEKIDVKIDVNKCIGIRMNVYERVGNQDTSVSISTGEIHFSLVHNLENKKPINRGLCNTLAIVTKTCFVGW